MAATLELTLPSQISALGTLEQAIEKFAGEQDWPPQLLFQMQLAVEELASNVIRHGFGEDGHEFDVWLRSSPESVTIEIVDAAQPYNPLTQAPAPDVEASLDERQIGGLGVLLVRDVADDMQYSREGGKNRLVIVKRRA